MGLLSFETFRKGVGQSMFGENAEPCAGAQMMKLQFRDQMKDRWGRRGRKREEGKEEGTGEEG